MKKHSIEEQLLKTKIKSYKQEEEVIQEVYKILNRDLFKEGKILGHLKLYNQSFELIDEDNADPLLIFTEEQIRQIAIKYRLKFIDSQHFKKDIPYEAILRIKYLNETQRKELKHFKILGTFNSIVRSKVNTNLLLFARTNHGNYFLIHSWGESLPWHRKISRWPLRRFETMLVTLCLITAIIACSLPTKLIWLPDHAEYWGTYRIGAFFHILIFNMGVTAYFTFALGKNFSSKSWNRIQELY